MDFKNTTILLVEDEKQISYMLSIILEDYFRHILIAENGEEGLKLIQENPEISCVLSDIHMPVMDGITMIKKVREKNIKVPFIFFTAYSDKVKMKKLAELDVYDLVTKPEFDNLEEIIQKAIESNYKDSEKSLKNLKFMSKFRANFKK